MATSFAVMTNAFVGIELASTMGDEIENPARDLPFAVSMAGAISLASYVLVTAAVLSLVPFGHLGVIQGVMQAVAAGAREAHVEWLVLRSRSSWGCRLAARLPPGSLARRACHSSRG